MTDYIFININDIDNCFDDFAKAKMDIEREKINANKLEAPQSLSAFISSLELYRKIYILNEKDMIVFNDIKTKEHNYLFYTNTSKETNSYVKTLKEILVKIHEGKMQLIENKTEDLISTEKTHPDYPYMLIDSVNYSIVSMS